MKLIVKILDTETNSVKWIRKVNNYSTFWWSDGNGSCDCNRRIFFERESDEYESDDDESCTYHRYYIINTFDGEESKYKDLKNDYKYDFDDLHLYNQHYENYTDIFYRINKLRKRESKLNEILDDEVN